MDTTRVFMAANSLFSVPCIKKEKYGLNLTSAMHAALDVTLCLGHVKLVNLRTRLMFNYRLNHENTTVRAELRPGKTGNV